MNWVIAQKEVYKQKSMGASSTKLWVPRGQDLCFLTAGKQSPCPGLDVCRSGPHSHRQNERWIPSPAVSGTPRYFWRESFPKVCFEEVGFFETTVAPRNAHCKRGPSAQQLGDTAYPVSVFKMHRYTRTLNQDHKNIKGFLRSPPVKNLF